METVDITEETAAAFLQERGWGVIHRREFRSDFEADFLRIWEHAAPCTMTSAERSYALYKAVQYIQKRNISGELVECGVWKGGSCMIMAETLCSLQEQRRTIRLYDTFNGMTEPTDKDIISWNGRPVKEKWEEELETKGKAFASWAAGLDEVKQNLQRTGYPMDRFLFEAGDVADTLKKNPLPEQIAILRLDTDWYASTALELELLFPRLVKGGILIIDDYGHFEGARKAVDEYFARIGTGLLLNRVDYTGRIGVKDW